MNRIGTPGNLGVDILYRNAAAVAQVPERLGITACGFSSMAHDGLRSSLVSPGLSVSMIARM